jgi:hypothetical protein
MSEALLATDIVEWLRSNAVGHERAKPRRLLLDYLHAQGHSVDDRGMRKAYEGMDKVGSSLKGLFWIVTAEDRRIAQGQLHAPSMAMLHRERVIRESGDGEQGRLF